MVIHAPPSLACLLLAVVAATSMGVKASPAVTGQNFRVTEDVAAQSPYVYKVGEGFVSWRKRAGENLDEDDIPNMVRRSTDSSYVRYGKRSDPPCTLLYLLRLPTEDMRMQHLNECTMSRQVRRDDPYVRFG